MWWFFGIIAMGIGYDAYAKKKDHDLKIKQIELEKKKMELEMKKERRKGQNEIVDVIEKNTEPKK